MTTVTTNRTADAELEHDVSVVRQHGMFRRQIHDDRRTVLLSIMDVLGEDRANEFGRDRDKLNRIWTPFNQADCAALLQALSSNQDVVTGPDHERLRELCDWLNKKIQASDLGEFMEGVSDSHRTILTPTLHAARSMQALIIDYGGSFVSCAGLSAYYAVVRELFSIEPPHFSSGGARLRADGSPTAFVTAACNRALALLARALEETAELIFQIYEYHSRLMEFQDDARQRLPSIWVNAELRRLTRATISKLRKHERHALLRIDISRFQALEALAEEPNPQSGIEVCLDIVTDMAQRYDQRIMASKKALKEIAAYRKSEKAKPGSALRLRRTSHAHETARYAVKQVKKEAKNIRNALRQAVHDGDFQCLASACAGLRQQAQRVRRSTRPARQFLETQIDKQLAAAKQPGVYWDAVELTYAASSYGELTNWSDDDRLVRARDHLSAALSDVGDFKLGVPSHTDEFGYRLHPIGADVIWALSRLIDKVHGALDTNLAQKMVRHFRSSRVTDFLTTLPVGWTHDNTGMGERASRWVTAINLLALERLERTLSRKINTRVHQHLTVTKPGEWSNPLTLGQLFYPDMGFSAIPAAEGGSEGGEHHGWPVCHYLESMRAHVYGIPTTDATTRSMVLHGPPGTGKTTLIEALAQSCEAALVEVTPSDLVVAGGEAVERRAKLVFEALSHLTNSVILFDEFDPVLRVREPSSHLGPPVQNIFSFLTPGMLTKLKKLHNSAASQRTAFALITNHIGTLDRAAIRSGRFDVRIGLYPPDLPSRFGRLLDQYVKDTPEPNRDELGRIAEIASRSAGGPMVTLAAPGWFTPGNQRAPGGAFGYIKNSRSVVMPMKDADPIDHNPGSGKLADNERSEWEWIHAWDGLAEGVRDVEELRSIADKPPEFSSRNLHELAKRVYSRTTNALAKLGGK